MHCQVVFSIFPYETISLLIGDYFNNPFSLFYTLRNPISTYPIALPLLHDNAVGNSVPPFSAEIGVSEVGVKVGDGQHNPLVVFLFVGKIVSDKQLHHLRGNVLRRFCGDDLFYGRRKKNVPVAQSSLFLCVKTPQTKYCPTSWSVAVLIVCSAEFQDTLSYYFMSSPSEMISFAEMCGLWYLVLLSGNPKWRDTALSRFLYASGVSNMIAL